MLLQVVSPDAGAIVRCSGPLSCGGGKPGDRLTRRFQHLYPIYIVKRACGVTLTRRSQRILA